MSDHDNTIHFAITHSTAGGILELWADIAEGLRERGHRTAGLVLYPPPDPDAKAADEEEWHPVVSRRPRSPIAALRMVAALVGYLRRHRPAVVVSSMPAANVLLPIAVTVARVPTRVFVSHHSPISTHNRLLDRIDGWTGCLPCVAGIVSVSHAVTATLSGKPDAYRAKTRTIHNALSERIERLLDTLPRRHGADGPLRLVAIGRLAYQKNYPVLIRAMAHVPDAVLEIIGGGEEHAALSALIAELGLGDRVTLCGLLPRNVALAKAASADVFVQVSRYEGHSLALIEAARLGLPLIVSDVAVQVEGVTAEDGTQCGIIVPLDDPRALAAAIMEMRQPATRAHWAALATHLGGEASNARMLDAYEALLAPVLRAG
ncbi:glycosyltransferase [Sphingomonas sp. 3-13AW]|jgi:glycosyltransferase involved in cell wall biosynthesis|uniref:glycosyltransferase n=1 Tax=Sphingomonas sp. 3-13AW TaxID=3050450 RepID=UPI003BB60E6B